MKPFRTSGTTGAPKRVNMDSALLQRRAARLPNVKGEGFASLRKLFVFLDPKSSTGMQYQQHMEKVGGKAIFATGDLKAVTKTILKEKPDGIVARPGMLLAVAGALNGQHKFQHAVSTGGRVPREHVGTLQAMAVRFVASYGTTETGTIALASADDLREGVTGKILPDVKVQIVPETSEIKVQTPTLVREYGGRRDKRAALKDGWFYTGDTGRITEDGRVVVTGESLARLGASNER